MPLLPQAAALFLLASTSTAKPFDPNRNPVDDLHAAEQQAAAEHKNILLDFGANWCAGCVYLDQELHDRKVLATRLQKGFVVVHVDVGGIFRSHGLKAILALYPTHPVKGWPHLFLLAPDGTLLLDQDPNQLMIDPRKKNYDYSTRTLSDFLDRWTPKTP